MRALTATFYSYAGGSGRSTLVANVGALRARKGKTLLWDLNIESPGLHLVPGLNPKGGNGHGLFEWICAWQGSGKSEFDYSALCKSIKTTSVEDQLHVLPAFGDRDNLTDLYQAAPINWHRLLREDINQGYKLFAGALKAFGKAGYETVLIDISSGLTDLGGLMTAILPHVSVLMGNGSAVSGKGLGEVWKTLQPLTEKQHPIRGARPPLERIAIASLMPENGTQRRAARKALRGYLGLSDDAPLQSVKFNPESMFIDYLMVDKFSDDDLAIQGYFRINDALDDIAAKLASHLNPAEVTPQPSAEEDYPEDGAPSL